MKKVLVSGCFDILHSGHIAFFEEASKCGELYVGVGSDSTVHELKGRKPVYSEKERLYLIQSLKYVKDAWINSGRGLMDFEEEALSLKPDIIFVNSDGFTADKKEFCKKHNIQLIVSNKLPLDGFPIQPATMMVRECTIPYRLDLAGGWLDQPFVSKYFSGSVVTISIEPDTEFNDRSGMSSSTRAKAIELWQTEIPRGDREKLAKILFAYENEPGRKYVSGSQDSIGIVFPGINKLEYESGKYWPAEIMTRTDERVLRFVEDHLYMVNLSPRQSSYDVLSDTRIDINEVMKLSAASDSLWDAALKQDLNQFGSAMKASFEAQIAMFPHMVNNYILGQIKEYSSDALGWKISGAGGGGYLVLVSGKKIRNALRIRIRRE
jgi:cytidyltransferase-like protein